MLLVNESANYILFQDFFTNIQIKDTACLFSSFSSVLQNMDSSITLWIIVGIAVFIGLSIFLLLFRSINLIFKVAVIAAVLIFLFGWAAVANIPNRIWQGIQSIGNASINVTINGQALSCAVVPSVEDGKKIVESVRPTINTLLGAISSQVEITTNESKTCAGKASVTVKSSSLEAANKVKDDIQKLLPNIPITLEQK